MNKLVSVAANVLNNAIICVKFFKIVICIAEILLTLLT